MDNCLNVAFNGDGTILVVVGFNNQFVVIEIGRSKVNSNKLILKRK
jgi:hypothetical protein